MNNYITKSNFKDILKEIKLNNLMRKKYGKYSKGEVLKYFNKV